MSYVALKPCSFAGQSFKVGQPVPLEVLQPGAAKNLVKMAVLAPTPTDGEPAQPVQEQAPATLTIKLHTDKGDVELIPTAEGIQAVFDVLSRKAQEAEAIIAGITDGDALIILHLTDSRKTIKDAVEARAKEIE